MYRRVVFVGLGGSGGKTLRFLKRDLRRWLTVNNWPESRDIPKGFQFLHIDTPTVADGKEAEVELLPDSEYQGLVGNGTSWPSITSQLDNKKGIEQEFAGWRVEPTLTIDPTIGAGQYRAVGRTVALAYIDHIKDSLKDVFIDIQLPEAVSELTELSKRAGDPNNSSANVADPIVVVISSLAGGTGAGLLMDVFDVMRTMATWADQSFGILYTPEVFRSLEGQKGNQTSGVQPNSLAAISEILNGYFWHGAESYQNDVQTVIGLKESKIMQNAGIVGSIKRSGPAYPILVGSTNASNVNLSSPEEVFETIGSALVSWCTDEVVQDRLIAYTMANWIQKTDSNNAVLDLLINRGTVQEQGRPAFNGLGCARVSVGTRYLEDYSSERLAKDAASHMAKYHQESFEAQQLMKDLKINDPSQIATEIAKSRLLSFVEECGLNEKGLNDNAVLTALRPGEFGSELQDAIGNATRLIRDGKATAKDFLDDIRGAVSSALLEFDSKMKPNLEKSVAQWVRSKPADVIKAVESSISQVGLSVTAKLLGQTIQYLTEPGKGVCDELMGENEHQACVRYASESEWYRRAEAVLASSSGRFSMQSNDRVGEAITEAFSYGQYIFEAQLRETASALLSDFASGFLRPLFNALNDSEYLLGSSYTDSTATWPNWDDGMPSTHLIPPSSEYTLIEPKDFSKVFSDSLALTIGGEEGTSHQSIARSSVISGDFLRKKMDESDSAKNELSPLKAISIEQSWSPGHYLGGAKGVKSAAVFNLKFSANDLVDRARKWLKRENTAFCELLSSDLRSYTENQNKAQNNFYVDLAEYKSRQGIFISKLQAALMASSPLVLLDNALLKMMDVPNGIRTQFSKFPFQGHELQKEVETLISPKLGSEGADINKYFVSSPLESVQVISMFEGAHHPFVIQSLLEPIAEKWGKEKVSPEKIDAFWTKRRARQLGEFIPAPQEHIVAMVRGWFTADLLGLLDCPKSIEKRPVRISQPWSLHQEPASFPDPLLTAPEDHEPLDMLAAVLEALSLAYVMVGQSNNLNALRPYIALRDFGMTLGGDKNVLRYANPNPLIATWITEGTVVSKLEGQEKDETALRVGLKSTMRDTLINVSDSSPVERKSALIGEINRIITEILVAENSYWTEVQTNKNKLNESPYWPTLLNTSNHPRIVINALTSLKTGIEKFKI
jgi:hypothetical protein